MTNYFQHSLPTHWVALSPHAKSDSGGCVTLVRKEAFKSGVTFQWHSLVPGRALTIVLAAAGQHLAVTNIHNNELSASARCSVETKLTELPHACTLHPSSWDAFAVGGFQSCGYGGPCS